MSRRPAKNLSSSPEDSLSTFSNLSFTPWQKNSPRVSSGFSGNKVGGVRAAHQDHRLSVPAERAVGVHFISVSEGFFLAPLPSWISFEAFRKCWDSKGSEPPAHRSQLHHRHPLPPHSRDPSMETVFGTQKVWQFFNR